MILAYLPRDGRIERIDVAGDAVLPVDALWIDMLQPTPAERAQVESALRIVLPTHEEAREIEPSDRLYVEGEARFMTATVLANADAPNPTADSITFILTSRNLVTLRFTDPRPIATCAGRLMRNPDSCGSGEDVLVALLEAIVDRIADVLEKVSVDLDSLSRVIFDDSAAKRRRRAGDRPDLRAVLKTLSRNEDLTTTARESLLSLIRLVRFFAPTLDGPARKGARELKNRLRTMRSDVASLNEYASFESQKANFLLDATLGLINIEQNRIIKIFSVVAVIFLPPTLVASVYGMNFDYMPELHWLAGYPWALGLMLVSAVLPILFFRRKRWL